MFGDNRSKPPFKSLDERSMKVEFNNTFDSFPPIELPSKWSSITRLIVSHLLHYHLNGAQALLTQDSTICLGS